MRRIAHLSDVHILDPRVATRRARYRLCTKLVSMGRPVDPQERLRKLTQALAIAKESGADHFVISGDLTEVGEQFEFERFAEVLHDARLPGDSVTLVPGNHDAYTTADAWEQATRGPLAFYARQSATRPGKVVERGEVIFLPIDTSCFQTMAWSGGVFSRSTAASVEARLSDAALRDKTFVLVMHHPPFHPHVVPFVRWIDGLRGAELLLQLLVRHPHLQLLHGHLHGGGNRILTSSPTSSGKPRLATARADVTRETPRMFGAPAVCDGSDEAPNVRLYDVTGGVLHSTDLRSDRRSKGD